MLYFNVEKKTIGATFTYPICFISAIALFACGGGNSGKSGAGDPGTSAGTSTSENSYITWTGSANGTTIYDNLGQQFRVSSINRNIYDKSGAKLTSLTVDTQSKIFNGNDQIGTVQLVNSVVNTNVAALVCSNGNRMAIRLTNNSYLVDCGTSGGTGTGGTGTGGTGTGGTGTGGTGTGGTGTGGTGTGGTGTGTGGGNTTITPISCAAGRGNGTNGIAFYSPNTYTSYSISNTSASSTATSSLTWGVQYTNVNNLASTSYSGSLRARLWAVSSSYRGGSIQGYVVGTFDPNFTGSGARSANQVYVGSYSTNTVQSTGSVNTPSRGSYCIVATLEEYNGQYLIDDWVQFGKSVEFN